MAESRSGFWRSVRELPQRTSLRAKLIAAVLALVAIALLIISVAGIQILKDDLLSTPDSELSATFGRATAYVENYLTSGNQATGQGLAVDWISGGKVHTVVQPVAGSFGPSGFGHFGPSPRPIPGPDVQANPGWLAANKGTVTLPAQSGSRRWRVLLQTVQFRTPSGGTIAGTVALGLDVSTIYTTIGQLAAIDLSVSVAVVLLLAILVITVIRASLRPLTDIEKTAGAIAAGDLARRVPERDTRTEMGRLGRSLNAMLSQIETAFTARSRSEAAARRSEQKMRQFVADASHELRTPLTAIRGFAEYYRQRGGIAAEGNGTGKLAPADLDRIMRRVEQESARMGILVEDMLLLARLDQQRPLARQTVDLLTLAADAVHDARVVAPNRSINLTVSTGAALLVIGDEVRLRQVIGNLMSNALSHTPHGTPIDVLIRSGSLDEAPSAVAVDVPSRPDQPAPPPEPAPPPGPARSATVRSAAVLEVTDHGPGLTAEQAEHAFERFYRADQARTSGGAGLGLAIVAALVTAHGGNVWVRSQPGSGATFSIALPLAPEVLQAADSDAEEAGDSTDDDPHAESTAWAAWQAESR
jgi:two-component system, OmpR family, sensor kinase